MNDKTASVDAILDAVARARDAWGDAAIRARRADAELDAYREELARETARLRAKYGADDAERLALEYRREAARLATSVERGALRAVPALALELLLAGEPSDEADALAWLDERKIQIHADTSGGDSVAAQLRTLVTEIDEDGVDAVNVTRADELTTYGFHELQSRDRDAHRVREPISISIHVDVIQDVHALRDEIRALEDETRAAVENRERERRRSLYEQLRLEFEPDAREGDDTE